MEYIDESTIANDTARILCCECGTAIEPNPANMCVGCLRSRSDITADIPKQGTLYFCKGCERYLQPPSDWVRCPLESLELMSLCLKKLKGLNRVKLIDAKFVWTEAHSKRIKVKLTVEGEVAGGAILQQIFIVEFTIAGQMCEDCHRTEAQDYWRALVQVRQKCENRKTFYYLEQLILKFKAHAQTLGMKQIHEGVDFFYANEAHARKMVDFLQNVLPVRCQKSKQLLSHDIHSNTYNYKFTFSIEIVPVSKDSVVCLPKKVSQHLGGIAQVCLVNRITNTIHLIDPRTAQIAELSSQSFFASPFNAIANPKQLSLYVVMDVEAVVEQKHFRGQGHISSKHLLADVWVVKESDFGSNVAYTHVRTHLGYILNPFDKVYGYNVAESNVNDPNFDKMDESRVPDVILVKKYYGSRSARRRFRNWKLKRLAEEANMDVNTDNENEEFDEFLEDLEDDQAIRQNINIFKSETKSVAVDDDDLDPDRPQISLQEMLEEMQIADVDMNDDEGI